MARTFTVAAPDGARLQVQEWPATGPGDGPTVVLAHGWTLTRASWLPVVEQLVGRGLRVVTYDQRGHGGSGPLRDQPSVRSLGDDLAAVLDVVAPAGPVVLGGHSMGGMTVMAYAGLHPESCAAPGGGVVVGATTPGDMQSTRRRAVGAGAMRRPAPITICGPPICM